MIDRNEMLETAKACGMNFAPAQFSGVLEAEVSEFDLEAYTQTITQKAAEAERERICAAIEAEDDYCVDEGDYMLDSDDCIKVARGEWERPDYSVDARGTGGEG